MQRPSDLGGGRRLKPWAILHSRFRLRPTSPFSYVGQVAANPRDAVISVFLNQLGVDLFSAPTWQSIFRGYEILSAPVFFLSTILLLQTLGP